jgi:hypothetical protein
MAENFQTINIDSLFPENNIEKNDVIDKDQIDIKNKTTQGGGTPNNTYNINNAGIFFQYTDTNGNIKYTGFKLNEIQNTNNPSFQLIKNLQNTSISDIGIPADINVNSLKTTNIDISNKQNLYIENKNNSIISEGIYYNVPMYNYYISNNNFSPSEDKKYFTCNSDKVYSISVNVDSSYLDNFGDRYLNVIKNNIIVFSYKSPVLVRPLNYTININFKHRFIVGDVLSFSFLHNCLEEDVTINHSNNILCISSII